MPSLLFICTGNVCRSPFAERFARHFLDTAAAPANGAAWNVSSLGTQAMSGHPMDTFMAAELVARGGTPEGFLARQATFDRLEDADLIVAMATSHREWVLEESPRLLSRAFTLGQIARFVEDEAGTRQGEEFLDALRRHRSRARRRDDVPDPYRRGEQAAAASAQMLTSRLTSVLPRLLPSS